MIHLVFNEADRPVLQEAIRLDESLSGEIILVRDDYAVGPVYNIYAEEGMAFRKEWWQSVCTGGDYENNVNEVNDAATLAAITETLRKDDTETVWIWAAQNKHDVCGYYWVLYHLKEFQGRVLILYMNNLPFINEKGNIFYPNRLSEILPKEFLKARKLARAITPSEFEVDADEWLRIASDNKEVRLLEGGKKIVQKDADFYDAGLRKYITGDWQKAAKIIHHFLGKEKETTGDAYLLWRLKGMVNQQQVDMQGKLAGMKDFEIKWKTS
jgi:hypothetical protein